MKSFVSKASRKLGYIIPAHIRLYAAKTISKLKGRTSIFLIIYLAQSSCSFDSGKYHDGNSITLGKIKEPNTESTSQNSDGASATKSPLNSQLAVISRALEQVALTQSTAAQDVTAAQATLLARKYDGYPQVVPRGSVFLGGGHTESIGVSIEQVIWDNGHNQARMQDASLQVEAANLRDWQYRNEIILEGVREFVEISRYSVRLTELHKLSQSLESIGDLLSIRLKGGVADRGEVLRLNTLLQSVKRRIIADNSKLRQAQMNLFELLPESEISPLTDLDAAIRLCRRDWQYGEAPEDAIARVSLSRAQVQEKIVRTSRLPRIVLDAGVNFNSGNLDQPSIGIRLDANNILGPGRKGKIEAARASIRSAGISYYLQGKETKAELEALNSSYESLLSDAASLRALSKKNNDSIMLFKEQLDVGSILLTEGADLYREQTDTRIALIDVQANTLINCLTSSQKRGLLAEKAALDEND